MSNKIGDENVANDIKILKKFCEYEEAVVLTDNALEEVQDAMQNILAELEQDKKRIQELEEQVKTLDEAYTGVIKESKKWFDIAHNSIPTQVVIDKIKENKQILDKTNDGNLRERLYIENGIMKELLKGERK